MLFCTYFFARESITHDLDGSGYRGEDFMHWVMDMFRWIIEIVLIPLEKNGFVLLQKRDKSWESFVTHKISAWVSSNTFILDV